VPLEAGLEVGEEDMLAILMFWMVDLAEGLALSPKRTRMYEFRVVTDGTVIAARPLVIMNPLARGWSVQNEW